MTMIDRIARYLLLAIIWAGAFVFAIGNSLSSWNNGSAITLLMIGMGFGAAVAATSWIVPKENSAAAAPAAPSTAQAGKSKRGAGDFDPLNLLSPEDLDDLRYELKERLRERILSGTDGELSSLDELIGPQAKRK